MKAVANSTGRSMDKIKSDYRDTGDLGLVAKVNGHTVFILYNIPSYLNYLMDIEQSRCPTYVVCCKETYSSIRVQDSSYNRQDHWPISKFYQRSCSPTFHSSLTL
jgi:hypothetical protein